MTAYQGFTVSRVTGGAAALALLVGMAGASASPQGGGGAKKAPTSAQVYKNIKVLKDLPADQMIPVMHKISTSLGVRCDYCHVIDRPTTPGGRPTGWEKDTKPEKEMARKMMLMTERLNRQEKILGGQATCFMCHQGHARPVTAAPEGGGPPPSSRPGGGDAPPRGR